MAADSRGFSDGRKRPIRETKYRLVTTVSAVPAAGTGERPPAQERATVLPVLRTRGSVSRQPADPLSASQLPENRSMRRRVPEAEQLRNRKAMTAVPAA